MTENYFNKLPLISYSNTICVDITKRVVVANTVQADLFAYFPYEIKAHQRADTIAERYYKDPSYDWLVYLSNDVVDPYYAFPLDDRTFSNFIVAKYGNFANAQQKILFWEMNWAGSTDENIPQSFYDSTLPEPLKKYYEAVYGENTRIVYYKRRRSDWQATTNMIVYFTIANVTGSFMTGEVVTLNQANVALSNSYVTFSNTTQVTAQHVLGNVSSNSISMYLIGTTSNATANVTSIVNVANNISQNEAAFWSPVYAYDYEVGLNEKRKFIKLIDAKYSMTVAEQLRKDMKS
jgi:hypothetical protein